eukprot:TRINITY_DN2724_c0_g1_i1.p1 TRINITY_DN2724_c0_g1~~TRINITY_DN2724_c0_g1_i1.p1  ORF type:complete len:1217 (+),score=289.43 TRINITY_DN2724_c0_g1_i1:298-3948(+)
MLKRGFKASKCKTSLRLVISRMRLVKNTREVKLKQMKKDLAQLLQSRQEGTARIRVEHIIREQNLLTAYEFIEVFCELIVARLPIIESQKDCPIDLKEAIATVIFSAPRCADLPELLDLRRMFVSKYGKEFVTAAAELRPDCGVNRNVIEKLSVRSPGGEIKLKVMKHIAQEHQVDWDPIESEKEFFSSPEDLLNGPSKFTGATEMSPVKQMDQASNLGNQQGNSGREKFVTSHAVDDAHQERPSSSSAYQIDEQSTRSAIREFDSKQSEPAKCLHAEDEHTGVKSFQCDRMPSATENKNGPTMNLESNAMGEALPPSRSLSLEETVRKEWTTNLKDAVSAAEAAAYAAERASVAAKAAVELSNRKRLQKEGSNLVSRDSNSSYKDDATNIKQERTEMKADSVFQKPELEDSSDELMSEIGSSTKFEHNFEASENFAPPCHKKQDHNILTASESVVQSSPAHEIQPKKYSTPLFDSSDEEGTEAVSFNDSALQETNMKSESFTRHSRNKYSESGSTSANLNLGKLGKTRITEDQYDHNAIFKREKSVSEPAFDESPPEKERTNTFRSGVPSFDDSDTEVLEREKKLIVEKHGDGVRKTNSLDTFSSNNLSHVSALKSNRKQNLGVENVSEQDFDSDTTPHAEPDQHYRKEKPLSRRRVKKSYRGIKTYEPSDDSEDADSNSENLKPEQQSRKEIPFSRRQNRKSYKGNKAYTSDVSDAAYSDSENEKPLKFGSTPKHMSILDISSNASSDYRSCMPSTVTKDMDPFSDSDTDIQFQNKTNTRTPDNDSRQSKHIEEEEDDSDADTSYLFTRRANRHNLQVGDQGGRNSMKKIYQKSVRSTSNRSPFSHDASGNVKSPKPLLAESVMQSRPQRDIPFSGRKIGFRGKELKAETNQSSRNGREQSRSESLPKQHIPFLARPNSEDAYSSGTSSENDHETASPQTRSRYKSAFEASKIFSKHPPGHAADSDTRDFQSDENSDFEGDEGDSKNRVSPLISSSSSSIRISSRLHAQQERSVAVSQRQKSYLDEDSHPLRESSSCLRGSYDTGSLPLQASRVQTIDDNPTKVTSPLHPKHSFKEDVSEVSSTRPQYKSTFSSLKTQLKAQPSQKSDDSDYEDDYKLKESPSVDCECKRTDTTESPRESNNQKAELDEETLPKKHSSFSKSESSQTGSGSRVSTDLKTGTSDSPRKLASHVHPKLPDYDSLSAMFGALKTNRH